MTMREKIAGILYDAGLANGDFVAGQILSALEEPSEAMVEAGANLPGAFQGTSARYAKVRETWSAMIKAAKGGEG